MHANRDGRQADMNPDNRARRGSRKGGRLAVALPMLVFATMAVVALFGLVGFVGAFAIYSQGLQPATDLEKIQFASESVIYDRTGTVELARFGGNERRQPVAYDQIAPILIDATTAIEDQSFWTNTGVDPVGIVSAALDTLRGNDRGASTITQQLVRQRLLDPDLVQDPHRLIERKLKEIIQSVRVTEAYPGDAGKQKIITAYLNQNYYGNGSYGVLAAAQGYFGVQTLDQLTLGQVALLAALPQSPSSYDLVRNAVKGPDGRLYVPLDADLPVVDRRNHILGLLAEDPSLLTLSGNKYTAQQFLDAMNEPIYLAPQTSQPAQQQWLAPHFVWAVRNELADRLCSGAETCPELERGGLKVITTLDWTLQQSAEKWVTAGVLLPHQADPEAFAAQIGVPFQPWMKKLEKLQVNNGALVAMDYQTGETLAYVGSAGYYRDDISSPKFQPQFDVLGDGWRQPGSAFKPFNYVTGINNGTMTAASMFMDVTTTFDNSSGYTPKDYDLLERGPLRMRSALQWSLNIPAVKALVINGIDNVFASAQKFGMTFQQDHPLAALSLTLGTEVTHPRDVAESYATMANAGSHIGYTTILRIQDSSGTDLVPPYTPPAGEAAVSPQAAYVMTNILASNTDPKQNPIWGEFAVRTADGTRRPATLKTGTNNDANDLVAFGYLPPPDDAGRAAGQYALVVGAWNGNSDGSPVLTAANPVLSTDVAAPVWVGFIEEASQSYPVTDFVRPDGIVEADVDAWSGGKPTQFTTQTYHEVFISGTVPGDDTTKVGMQVVPDANGNDVLWVDGCPGTPQTKGYLALDNVEADHADWHAANADWIARARAGGPGTAGGPDPDVNTKTSYIFNGRYTPYGKSWGAPFAPTTSCVPGASISPSLEPSLSPSPSIEISPTIPIPTIEITPPPITPPPITPPPATDTPPPPTEPPPTEPPPTEPPPTEPPPPTVEPPTVPPVSIAPQPT
jgi:penicillin-binding protein 1A